MRILRVNDDHYVVETREQVERYALVLLNQHLATGTCPDGMRKLAVTVCAEEDGSTALQLLAKVDDVAVIPTKVL